MTAPAPVRLSNTLEVETPELVELSYTIAGVGSRAYAALIDYTICIALVFIIDVGFVALFSKPGTAAPTSSTAFAVAVVIIMQFAVLWGYYVLFEALADGRTPGKRLQRLRVVRDGGYSVTFGASAVRNLMRIVDMQPLFMYGVGMVSVLVSKSGKRLGDMAAGTIVVKEDIVRVPAPVAPARTDATPMRLHAALSAAEYDLLERFSQRQRDLDPGRRAQLAEQLAARFAPALAEFSGGTAAARLGHLLNAEREARAAGSASNRDTGAARERHAIVANESARWAGFAATLTEAQRRGLKGLGERGVREFVAEYRDLAAALARLRTASKGTEVDEVFYLNRLVAAAHNLLYRRRAIVPRDIMRYVFGEVPREIRASALPILLAAALLFGPAAIAGTAVLRDPAVARLVVPPGMLDRADEGVRRAKNGDGYIEDPQIFRPVMATGIIANNVQVAIAAFASGVTAGVVTAFLLVSNGVSLGAVFGLYGSKGIATLLLAFVAPHGVLELTAICIAGGAGFLLAAA
ncbi:MAG TPA: stage II sporulation protein M, partial [Gemmatimonadaceae bacterium]